jgi:hypothetical protein
MSDYNSQLPVRSKQDADERLQAKLVDATNPDTQQMEIDTDNNAHVEVHGNEPQAAGDVALLLSEQGRVNPRGDYDGTTNSKPASIGMIAHTRGATIDETVQAERITAVAGESDSICLDVSLHDEAGNNYDENNPLPVAISENEGNEKHEFDKADSIAKDATSEHTYTVVDGKTALLYGVHARASGKLKAELQIGDGAASETFETKDVNFNSTAHPKADMDFYRVPIKVTGTVEGTTIKLIKTNLDNQAQDLYSTFIIVEKDTTI